MQKLGFRIKVRVRLRILRSLRRRWAAVKPRGSRDRERHRLLRLPASLYVAVARSMASGRSDKRPSGAQANLSPASSLRCREITVHGTTKRPRRLSVVSGTEMPEQSNGAESLFRAQGAGDRSGRRLLIAKVENSAQVGRGRGQSTVSVKAGLNSQNGCVTNRRDSPLDSLD